MKKQLLLVTAVTLIAQLAAFAKLWLTARLFGVGPELDGATLTAVTDAIRQRGPDADGHWLDATNGVALGHRRLAILDLTPAGAQLMQSHCGHYVIAFNGEVYNFAALGERARGWRSISR